MSEQFEEYEIIGSTGKHPKDAFTGIFRGYEYTENVNKTKELKLNFDEDTVVTIYGRGKLSDDGKAAGGLALWINSLAALNIKSFAARDGNELIGLRHEPDITNAKISIVPDVKKIVGDDTQTKEEKWWGIAKQVILDTPAGKLTGKPVAKASAKGKATAVPAPALDNELVNKIEDMLLENDKLSVGDIYKQFGGTGKSPYKPDAIRAAIAIINAKE